MCGIYPPTERQMFAMVKAIRRLLVSAGVKRALGASFIGAFAFNVSATNHILRQDEIMAGLNGDARIQFVEITVSGGDQKAWGPPGPSLPSRAMLVFFNGAGVEVGRFFFP